MKLSIKETEALKSQPHRRFNPLTGEWILVSPHRTQRPWQGKLEVQSNLDKPEYDPNCYLCPDNERAGGAVNPNYKTTFAFDNDFSALVPASEDFYLNYKNLIVAHGEKGICRVICFSPKHNVTLAQMTIKQIEKVIDLWRKEYLTLGENEFINYVQIFENKGEIMGCSNPHPHGQIWAQHTIPVEPAKEISNMTSYFRKNKSCLLCDYLKMELKLKERIVYSNDEFVVLVPFWAIWPFETMILPLGHLKSLKEFKGKIKKEFADAISVLTKKYDNLFNISFPYSSGIHQQPTDGKEYDGLHFHMHFYPPLLRSATVKKFMVGYEMMANPQRDITAEFSAQTLRKIKVNN